MRVIGGFVLHTVLLLVLFLALIDNIFLFRGKIFWLEAIIIAGMIVLAVVVMSHYAHSRLLLLYGIMLLNAIVLSSIANEIFWLSLVAAAIGTFVSLRRKEARYTDFSETRVEEVPPEPMSPEMLAGVQQPVVESRVIERASAKKKAKRARKRKKK